MVRRRWIAGVIGGILALILILMSCGGGGNGGGNGGDGGGGGQSPTPTRTVITIGNLTDLTGVGSEGMRTVNMALKDLARYYNEKNLIPNVELKVIEYDNQYDPSKDVPGYEWLRQRGSQLVFTPVPPSGMTLKSKANADQIPLFVCSLPVEETLPPGYVFCVGLTPEYEAYTFLQWLAENDPDFPKGRPAKIGGAGWNDAYTPAFFKAAQAYCKKHPDQFEWVGGYLTNFSFSWEAETSALKDADYVVPPGMLVNFAKQYRGAGGKGKLLIVDPYIAVSWKLILEANIFNELDRSLVLRTSKWWTDEGDFLDLTKQILYTYHPESAKEIMDEGVGYLGISNAYVVLEAIRHTVGLTGARKFSSEALYEGAQTMSVTVDGVEQYSFGPSKRTAANYELIYEIRADRADMVRISDWYPMVFEP